MRADAKIAWNETHMSMEPRCAKNTLLGVHKMTKGERHLHNYFESGSSLWEVGHIEHNDGKKISSEKKKSPLNVDLHFMITKWNF